MHFLSPSSSCISLFRSHILFHNGLSLHFLYANSFFAHKLHKLHQRAGKLWTSINWLTGLRYTRMTAKKMTNDDSVAYALNAWERPVPSIYSIIHF